MPKQDIMIKKSLYHRDVSELLNGKKRVNFMYKKLDLGGDCGAKDSSYLVLENYSFYYASSPLSTL